MRNLGADLFVLLRLLCSSPAATSFTSTSASSLSLLNSTSTIKCGQFTEVKYPVPNSEVTLCLPKAYKPIQAADRIEDFSHDAIYYNDKAIARSGETPIKGKGSYRFDFLLDMVLTVQSTPQYIAYLDRYVIRHMLEGLYDYFVTEKHPFGAIRFELWLKIGDKAWKEIGQGFFSTDRPWVTTNLSLVNKSTIISVTSEYQ